MKDILLSQDELKRSIEYNPKSGEFFRIKSNAKAMSDPNTGDVILVGSRASADSVYIDGIECKTCDIIWMHYHGRRPIKQLEFIDRKPRNLRIKNIRSSSFPNPHPVPDSITVDKVRELFVYYPKTGMIYWRKPIERKILTGTSDNERGYLQLSVNGQIYPATQLAWLYMTGEFSPYMIKHRNNNGWDYRWANLYESTPYVRDLLRKWTA